MEYLWHASVQSLDHLIYCACPQKCISFISATGRRGIRAEKSRKKSMTVLLKAAEADSERL